MDQEQFSGLLKQAISDHQSGNHAQAENAYLRILEVAPDHPTALQYLGLLRFQRGDGDGGVTLMQRAATQAPHDAELHINLGGVLRALKRPAEAIHALEIAIALSPGNADAHYGLGNALMDCGNPGKAATSYENAIALRPEFIQARSNLANALRQDGKLDASINACRQALALGGDALELRQNLAASLIALADENLRRDRHMDAIALYRQAIAHHPSAAAHHNLAQSLADSGNTEDAAAHFRLAANLDPHSAESWNQLCQTRRKLCDWDGLDGDVAAMLGLVRSNGGGRVNPFPLLNIASTSADQLRVARNWAKDLPSQPKPPRSPTLRIGFLSSDFRDHAVGAAIVHVLERLSFKAYAYATQPRDNSPISARIAAACHAFTDLTALPDLAAAQRIREDGIGILLDLNGYTAHARPGILAARAAPIQVNYLGYPGTSGADFMDAILADSFVIPESSDYSEHLVPLPGCYLPRDTTCLPTEPGPPRAQCGLPEDFVFCAFNALHKISPDVFSIWMRLLGALPASVLWLPQGNPTAQANLHRQAAAQGISPQRLIFAPKQPKMEDHLARIRLADLFLDTHPYNAHMTASDALWAGLPVLTCAGTTFASRVAGSLLHHLGLPELVTHSPQAYEATALRLAQNPKELATLRQRLGQNRRHGFDMEIYARGFEAALKKMWEVKAFCA